MELLNNIYQWFLSISAETWQNWGVLIAGGAVTTVILSFITPHIERKGWKVAWLGVISGLLTGGDAVFEIVAPAIPWPSKWLSVIGSATLLYRFVVKPLAVRIQKHFAYTAAGKQLLNPAPLVEEVQVAPQTQEQVQEFA